MSDATDRDLDETRRLALIAKITVRTDRPASTELAGTLANAIAYHSKMVNPKYAEEVGIALVSLFDNEPDPEQTKTILSILDTIIRKCESSS